VIPPSEGDDQAIGKEGWKDIDRQDSKVEEDADERDEEKSTSGQEPEQAEPTTTTRSGRAWRPATCFITLCVNWEVFHNNCYDNCHATQDAIEDPIAFAALSNLDIMCLNQAMKEPDKEHFEQAMLDEVKSHADLGHHWETVTKKSAPITTKGLPSVWGMRRKRRMSTGVAYKRKTRLNLHGGK
jgi:hypothetical protein